MKHIILGTAGHVDHGKTALIKALTGVDTDRLKEEKERGITIELGFASLPLQEGRTIGIVDVPGHERFIKNMVSGATGIDLVMLVIAADEGVMPQTREHLNICSLLGIKNGLVALTKIDLVTEDWLDLVKDDIQEFLKGTFMETSPIVPVSSLMGTGLPELINALSKVASDVEEKTDTGLFMLAVDRVFTMRGFGTVVTGTLTSGQIKVGEAVEILPGRKIAKIRGIQIHNKPVSLAEAGQRTAINLQGIEKTLIKRGDVLARPGTYEPSSRLDVFFDYLLSAEKKIKNRTLVRFHIGTSDVLARLILLNRDEIEPGDKVYAQINLESPVISAGRNRFVIRSYSPVTTIGGGMVIDPLAQKHKRHSNKVHREFQLLHEGTELERVTASIERAGPQGMDIIHLVIRTGLEQNILKEILETLKKDGRIVILDREETGIVSEGIYRNIQAKIIEETKMFHNKFPLKDGLSREELRTMLGSYINPKLFNAAIRDLENSGMIVSERENVRLPHHYVDLTGELEELRKKIADLYLNAGLSAPTIREVMEKFSNRNIQVDSIMTIMIKEGLLIKVNEDLYYHKDVLRNLREAYKNLLLKDGKATPVTFKELTGLSRKFIIPLMEYFDMSKLTIRAGDYRILREK